MLRYSSWCKDSYEKSKYLRESTVVPDVTLVGEAIADISQLALLGVLLDRVEGILLANLW